MILAPARRTALPGRRPVTPFWRNPLAARPTRHRHRPYCPLYNMADGDISLDASGNRILDASGNVYLKCCCTVACTDCPGGVGPLTVTAVISGTTLCTGCQAWPTSTEWTNVAGTANGSFALASHGAGSCQWEQLYTGSDMFITGTIGVGTACTGSPAAITANSILYSTLGSHSDLAIQVFTGPVGHFTSSVAVCVFNFPSTACSGSLGPQANAYTNACGVGLTQLAPHGQATIFF